VLATLAIGALVLSPVAQGAYAGELPAPPQSPAAEHPAQATTGSVPTYSQGLRSQKALIADVPDDSTASTPTPEQRLTRVDVARDLVKKTITAKATFAEAPTSDRDSAVYVFLGTWSGSSCTGRVVTAAAAASRSQFGALLGSDGTVDEEVDTTRSRSGKVLTIVTGPHDRIRTAKLDCAYALNLGAGDPAPRYTDFYAEDLENTFAPKLEVSTREPLQGNYKGKTTKVRIEVDNIGESDAKNVRIKASGTGLKISKPSRTIAKIEDGRSKFLTFNVTLTSKKQRTLTVTAVATGGKKVSTKVTIVEKPKPKKYKSLSLHADDPQRLLRLGDARRMVPQRQVGLHGRSEEREEAQLHEGQLGVQALRLQPEDRGREDRLPEVQGHDGGLHLQGTEEGLQEVRIRADHAGEEGIDLLHDAQARRLERILHDHLHRHQ
jgi:hypothetical protein